MGRSRTVVVSLAGLGGGGSGGKRLLRPLPFLRDGGSAVPQDRSLALLLLFPKEKKGQR